MVVRKTKVNNLKLSHEKNKVIRKTRSSDTNNNGNLSVSSGKIPASTKSNYKHDNTSPKKNQNTRVLRKLPQRNNSLRLLEDKPCTKRDASKLDVYEFTFDPNEEPPPPKKKKKRVVKKNPVKTKTVTMKFNYDRNLAKALSALKKTVSAKSSQSNKVPQKDKLIEETSCAKVDANDNRETTLVSSSSENKQNAMRVEDIALDFQEDDHHLNYSPINSPAIPAPDIKVSNRPHDKDPLNLLDDVSFFDEQPIANSSINTSVRHPLASPWRVEFENLPIKWPVNVYVKPNMTPAVETSFIDSSENKKKHVYTDIISDTNNFPQIIDKTPNLKQTSIVSFIKEVIERSANKKKNKIASNNSLFEDMSYNKSVSCITPQKSCLPNNVLSSTKNIMKPIENNSLLSKHNDEKLNEEVSFKNSTPKNVENNVTYFGFDENEDQENISPLKKSTKARALRSRSRAVLHEINGTRNLGTIIVPQNTRSKSVLNHVNKVFNEEKSAREPPVFPKVNVQGNSELTNINSPTIQNELENEESQSVHLFEDIDIVHHLKPTRKSYSRTRKVTFRQNSADSDSRDSDVDAQHNSSDEGLDDLSFKLPCIKEKRVNKKKKTKKQLSKKEEKELEAWAAGFNSMCEDVDEFDLVVE